MARAVSFTKAAVARALAGVIEAGIPRERIAGLRVSRDGNIVIQFGEPRVTTVDDDNEWDDVLEEKPS